MSSKKHQEQLRNAAEPFIINFDNNQYLLTEDALKRQIESRLHNNRNPKYPKLKFISFDAGTILFQNSFSEHCYDLTILLEADKLHISCSCKEHVQTICIHSFKALQRWTIFGTDEYLCQFKPGGLYELAIDNKKFFNIIPTDQGLSINPKDNVHNIFGISKEVRSFDCKEILQSKILSAAFLAIPTEQVCFVILGNERYRNRLSLLLPCIGSFNKDRTSIKQFSKFSIKDKKPVLDNLPASATESERPLYEICEQLYQQPADLSGSLFDWELKALSEYFQLWQKAATQLHNQPFVYTHPHFLDKRLRDEPDKQSMVRVYVQLEAPKLHFTWTDKESYCELIMEVHVNGKRLTSFEYVKNFFIQSGDNLFLLSNIRDCLLMEWMCKAGGKIIVLNEHFHLFRDNYLDPLREYYSIKALNEF